MADPHRCEDRRRAAAAGRNRARPAPPPRPTRLDGRARHRRQTPARADPRRRLPHAGKRRRPVGRDEARRLLACGLRSCTHCRPDTQLDIDLPRGTTPAPATVPCRKDIPRDEHSSALASGRRP
ncbi:DUF6233 domain-containing protein [Streptomyces sp. NPDC102259]|uniref:DUF6233 domain-containing protein n=1 Tax=Streptomyces sp. NPDC102259 TaxID=3366148 RepID=UPI00382CBFC1